MKGLQARLAVLIILAMSLAVALPALARKGPSNPRDQDRMLIQSPSLRIKRLYILGRNVVVDVERVGDVLLSETDYAFARVSVSIYPSYTFTRSITLGDLDRARHMNTERRFMTWITPMVLGERTQVSAVIRLHKKRHERIEWLTPS